MNIVLVLGAGSSCPFGFPLGRELVNAALTPDGEVDALLQDAGHSAQDLERFRDVLHRASPNSIDEFLEHRADFLDLGKSVIAALLLRAEQKSHGDRSERRGHWYDYLFKCTDGQIEYGAFWTKLSIITYNYDRSFERWLLDKLEALLGKSEAEALSQLQRMRLVHVHGALGSLDPASENHVPYGKFGDPGAIRVAMRAIQIIHELPRQGTLPESLSRAHKFLRQASHIVFLGFGYHETNLERLDLRNHCTERDKRFVDWDRVAISNTPVRASVYGTAYGLTTAEARQLVKDKLRQYGLILDEPSTNSDTLEFLRDHPGIFDAAKKEALPRRA